MENQRNENLDNDEAQGASEGQLTKQVEQITTTIPSGAFLTTAVGAMAASTLLQVYGKKQTSQFIGQWVPAILIMGVYNKLVKLHGSENHRPQ